MATSRKTPLTIFGDGDLFLLLPFYISIFPIPSSELFIFTGIGDDDADPNDG